MNNKIKKTIYVFILAATLIFIGIDYLNFNIKKPYQSNLVFGNKLVPSSVVVSYLDNDKLNNQNIFSSIIDDLKIVNVSSNKSMIIVKESLPRFFDNKNIYLSSGVKVQYKDYPNYNLLLRKIVIPKFESESNIDISDNILDLMNLLSDSGNPILERLDLIRLSEDNTLSMQSGNCEIIILDKISKDNKNKIYSKIMVLNEFINQSGESIDSIAHIDLRWSDRIFIRTI